MDELELVKPILYDKKNIGICMLSNEIKNKINKILNIDFPEYVMKEIEYCFRDGNIKNLDINNIYYKFKNGPIKYKETKDLYWIPFHSKILISKNGMVYRILKGVRIKLKIQKSKPGFINKKNITHGYNNTSVKNDLNKSSTGVHRLLALAFIDYKDSPIRPYTLYVNHINGKPGDDRIENLEWVTPRENLIHAIENGLMPNSITPIDMKNIKTGEILSFPSITKAAEYLKWPRSKLFNRLIKNNKVYPDMWIFKYQENDWPNVDKTITRMGSKMKVVSVNPETGEIKEHETIMHAASYTGVNTTSISWNARLNNGKPVKGIEFYFLDNYNNKNK